MKVETASGKRPVERGRDGSDGAVGSRARILAVSAPVVLGISLTIAVLWGLTTAQSRISASTQTRSLMTAGQIDLIVEDGSEPAIERLVFDETGLYAGAVVQRCLVVRYEGTFESAAIRMHGSATLDTGLAGFIDTSVDRGTGQDPECTDFARSSTIYTGTLDSLLARNTSFSDGLVIAEPSKAGRSTTIRLRLEVRDDNLAQGLDTSFLLFFEARP